MVKGECERCRSPRSPSHAIQYLLACNARCFCTTTGPTSTPRFVFAPTLFCCLPAAMVGPQLPPCCFVARARLPVGKRVSRRVGCTRCWAKSRAPRWCMGSIGSVWWCTGSPLAGRRILGLCAAAGVARWPPCCSGRSTACTSASRPFAAGCTKPRWCGDAHGRC